MGKLSNASKVAVALALILTSFAPTAAQAEDTIEQAGATVGVTAGNLWFIPAKAVSVANGILTGALSFVVTGGNFDLTKQIWQDTTEPPYLITPEVARKGIGERPELSKTTEDKQ
jgi:hypothetical protein